MKKLFIVGVLLFNISCSGSTKSSWNCPTPKGGKGSCVSIREADISENMILGGKSDFIYSNAAQKIEIKLIAPKLKELKKFQQNNKELTQQVSQITKERKLFRE